MPKPRFSPGPLWQFLCPAWNAPTSTQPSLVVKQTRQFAGLSSRSCIKSGTSIPSSSSHHSSVPANRHHRVKRIVPDSSSLDVPVESLYTRLNASAIEGDIRDCQTVVEHLLQKRGERLSVTLYNALVLANVDAVSGGAWRVRSLLEEMEVERYVPDTITCHNILKVLAVHPDHLLRTDVLHRMKENWFTLSVDGQHDVAAGWLREGCLEMAMEVLEKLQQDGKAIEPWLLDMCVYSLCDAQEIDAAYNIMRTRRDNGELNISSALWHYFLDAATSARHFAGTELAWRSKIRLGQLQVSTGICENALATVSAHGSPALATDIFAYFTKRGDPASHFHYQLLIDSYLNCDPPDISRAISVLSVMPLERLQPTEWQTRSLFACIRGSDELSAETLSIIRDLQEKGRVVPIALVNVIIESLVYRDRHSEAIDLYQQIPTLLSSTPEKAVPDLDTFNLVFRACELSDPPNVQQAEIMVSSMQDRSLDLPQDVHDRLVSMRRVASSTLLSEAAFEQEHALAASAA